LAGPPPGFTARRPTSHQWPAGAEEKLYVFDAQEAPY
jgi:hypothetical protein